MAYTVINNTAQKIWWRDGAWTSGEIDPQVHHQVSSDHDANVTMFGKSGRTDVEWGYLWIPNGGIVTVNGKWNWDVRPSQIELLDVWGEGRIVTSDGIVTGFKQAYNVNKWDQKISNGPNKGNEIPKLLAVYDYDNPKFPIKDDMVSYITLMGAPITPSTAKEMHRVLEKSRGVVILYDPGNQDKKNFEMHMGRLIYKKDNPLNAPFNEITIRPAFIYGFPGVHDHDEL